MTRKIDSQPREVPTRLDVATTRPSADMAAELEDQLLHLGTRPPESALVGARSEFVPAPTPQDPARRRVVYHYPDVAPPAHALVLTAAKGGNAIPVILMPGQPLVIELERNPSTGFHWRCNEGIPKPEIKVVSSSNPIPGDPSQAGTGEVTCVEHHVWSPEQLRSMGQDFTLTMQLVKTLPTRDHILGDIHYHLSVAT